MTLITFSFLLSVERLWDEDTGMKYRAWGWNVLEIDGNNPDAIREALVAANKEESRPTLIIGRTIMAKGALQADGSSYENSIKHMAHHWVVMPIEIQLRILVVT